MGVYQRKGSKYWHVWLDGARRPRVNTKIPIGTTAKQRKESRKLAEQAFFSLMLDRAGERFGLARKPKRLFSEHRAWYDEHVTALKRSAYGERSMLKQLGTFFDDYPLSRIDQALVREWRAKQAKTLKGSTIRRLEALLRHLLTTAIPDYLTKNPLIGLPSVRMAPTDTIVLSRDEETRLLATLKTPVDRAIIIGALDTLLRQSNIVRLTRAQDHGSYLFSDTKNGPVKIPISTRFRQALDALPKAGKFYFPRYALLDSGEKEAAKMFQRACKRADILTGRKEGGLSFHCLRHTGATRMLAAGVNFKTVMKIGGWTNPRVMERYLHPADALSVEAVEAIGRG